MKQLMLIFCLFASSVWAQSHVELIVQNKIDHLSSLAREPMVVQHPNGTLFVTGFANQNDSPQLWKSTDMGKNWEKVNVGTKEDGARGNSDVDLFIDSKGNIYLLSMIYTKVPLNTENFDFSNMKGEGVTLGISRDEGASWEWRTISDNDYDDRPWIAETSNGSMHIIWNDGRGIHHAESKDEGRTWGKQEDICPKGGSSYLSAGYNGQLAVRAVPLSASAHKIDEGVDLIRLSLDNGNSWRDVEIPWHGTWKQDFSDVPRWVEPLAWDKKDRLYALSSSGTALKLNVTSDNGQSWEEYTVAQSADTLYFPYMAMSDKGILCTWVSSFNNDIKHHAALIVLKEKKATTYAIAPQTIDIWRRPFVVSNNAGRETGGEYFPVMQLSNGNIGMVTPIQNPKANRLGFTWWELVLNKF